MSASLYSCSFLAVCIRHSTVCEVNEQNTSRTFLLAPVHSAGPCASLLPSHHGDVIVPHTSTPVYALHQLCIRRPASAERTVRRQFQATGQPVSRTQASDAMTSRLPRYEANCVQCRCFQCGSVPLRSDIKGTELPPPNILIPLERQLIALQLCC